MKQLYEVLQKDQSFQKAIKAFSQKNSHSYIYSITGLQKRLLIAASYANFKRPVLVIVNNRETMKEYYSDLAMLLPDAAVLELPAMDIVTFTADAKSINLLAARMEIFNRMLRGEPIIVLATAEAVIQKVSSREEFLHNRISIKVGEKTDRDLLLTKLVNFGYERVEQVDGLGQFSVRGGIIDIFAVNTQQAVRIELFDDEVDSIREFNIQTQRSVEHQQHVDIMPLVHNVNKNHTEIIFSYCSEDTAIVFDEPFRLREAINAKWRENPDIKAELFSWHDIMVHTKKNIVVSMALMLQKNPHADISNIISLSTKSIASYNRQIEMLINELKVWQQHQYYICIFMTTKEKALAMQRNLVQERINAVWAEDYSTLLPGTVTVTNGVLSGGCEFVDAKLVILTEGDIFGRQKKRARFAAQKGEKINYFTDIKVGDYVVHVNHGIGKYIGVETLSVGEVHKDYLHIRYAGEDKLYVPVDQVHLLHKYIGAEGQAPKLNKLGGSDWLKTKAKTKNAVTDIAKELLKLYAQRQVAKGFAFDADTPWQKEFEDAFPFEETKDQLTAIAEVKADMEKPRPMDRLLCGDVGFGKTEVAIRAAFKAVMNSKQVAVLVPTTVLAQQHFQTFAARFDGFGPVVDVLSRFKSTREQKQIIERVKEGKIDILIGTHRILQSDVIFKDLGLLIVDEEQRFGVSQKEKLKKYKNKIDVLTLTATPIPRTLHMALAGSRDMSIIETPPEDRLPVQTYVVEYNDKIIADAIRRELRRGGSVYFVYNRVQTIDKMYRHLSELVPEARIKVAHGQMPEELLEAAMLEFYEGKYDILLSTSIIENGLDIPDANTIIIYAADNFGLSQLYQMRGRVGRSSRLAYAYFTYKKDKALTEIAEKRLQAIREFAELGSGFKIAMRDLEIRGAGNLLGREQHGHIASVGFEMYCRLLEETIEELKNNCRHVEIHSDPIIELDVDAYLTGDYITDAMHKIEIYQRIAAVRKEEHIKDLLDELIDRFGDPPATVLNLLSVARVKNYARTLGIKSIIQNNENVKIIFADNPNVSVENILKLKSRYPARVTMNPGPPGSINIKTAKDSSAIIKQIEKMLGILVE